MYVFDNDPHRELAGLGFERLPPSPRLRQVVQCFWGARALLKTPRVENLYPDGGWGLSFSFAEPPTGYGKAYAHGALDGVTARRRELALAGAVDLFGVRFQPGAALELIDADWSVARDQVVPLNDLGGILSGLEHRLARVSTTAARASQVETFLGSWLDPRKPGLVEAAHGLVTQGRGKLRIDEVAARLGVSQRTLERTFRARVGLAPKTVAGLERVRRARMALKLARDQRLADIALDVGFFDQAHFTRDFKRMVGMTPGHYRRRALQRRLENAPSV